LGGVGRFWVWVGDGILVVSAGEAVGAPGSGDVWIIGQIKILFVVQLPTSTVQRPCCRHALHSLELQA